MTQSFLYAATRTPFGRFGGALAEVRPDDLAAAALSGVLAQVGDLDPERIGDVIWGCANQAGEDNWNVARMALLLADHHHLAASQGSEAGHDGRIVRKQPIAANFRERFQHAVDVVDHVRAFGVPGQ